MRRFLRLFTPVFLAVMLSPGPAVRADDGLRREFQSPPDSARPWVYWYFMDGHISRDGITADLESWKKSGIGGGIFLTVNVGIPRGPVDYMGPQWQDLFVHAVHESDRLGLELAFGAGPGWCGTGGPWVKPDQSMQDLVFSATTVKGPAKFDRVLPRPKPRTPYFGLGTMTPSLRKLYDDFYADVAVIAFPTPAPGPLANVDETALYYRAPFSSVAGVKPFLPAGGDLADVPADQRIPSTGVIELTQLLHPDGTLDWQVPPGDWTILRYGRTITGQVTRPAPDPGLGFETDKFSKAALDAHFESAIEPLLAKTGPVGKPGRGLTTLHFDSWEMSSQNWSPDFRRQFVQRRGYDPLKYLPAMSGRTVDSPEVTARFLWDLRQTAQELTLDNHLKHLKELGKKHGLTLSVEPYDMDPCADLNMGSAADLPMCEFWSPGYGFHSEYSAFEATSIAHVQGKPVVGAESFTSDGGEAWHQYPGAMKAQTDWAFAAGVNKIVFHRYQHQDQPTREPGMAMGPYGVHWERTQTWWDMVPAYHQYIARCSDMLRKGVTVADVLYLTPEGAPLVFRPPPSAITGQWGDRRGYNFDGCDPHALIEKAAVVDGRIAFPGGTSYRVLVLPEIQTMTPELLKKIRQLLNDGATVMGAAPERSPSLVGYPACDKTVRELAAGIWTTAGDHAVGKGLLVQDQLPANPPGTDALQEARWIWSGEPNAASAAPIGTRHFRRTIHLGDSPVQSARFTITADNNYRLTVNGNAVGKGDDFHVEDSYDIARWLKPGDNDLAVTAENTGENSGNQPNPAGLIGALSVTTVDGKTATVVTDEHWEVSADESSWGPAQNLGPQGMSPWHLSGGSFDIYPVYDKTAAILARLGTAPDFESDGPVRYTHRRDGDTDIYFVANTTEQALSAACRFRVTGKQPEWWDPRTGLCRDLPEFTEAGGITTVPIRFDSVGSGFVLFRHPPVSPPVAGKNFTETRTVQTLDAAWEVTFDPARGGPGKVAFDKLVDWTTRPEPGIKYYSGKAVYQTRFDAAAESAGKPCAISLGTVFDIASVKLNGHDLGIAWCAPWHVEVPAGLLKRRGNELEITVANLWINRLIGDAALPESKRITWTTYNPYHADSPLQRSGLIGPVELTTP